MKRVSRRMFVQVATVGTASLALSACGNDPDTVDLHPTLIANVPDSPPTPPPPGSPAAGEEQQAAAPAESGGMSAVALKAQDPYSWDKKAFDVAPGQTIEVTNDGFSNHDFSVDEWSVNEPLPPGEPVDVTVPDDVTPGQTFQYYCSVPGHRQNGMEGTLTIVEASAASPAGGAPQPAGQPAGGGGQPPAGGGATSAELLAKDPYSWEPKDLSLSAGQTLTVTNDGFSNHDFSVDEWGINDPLTPGEPVEVTIPGDVTAGQTFVFYCSVPGHRENGMEGTITIV